MIKLFTENSSAEISPLGAELKSLKFGTTEYLWQGDSIHWDESAPVLFPIVGALRDNHTYIDGKEYSIPKHGFAKNMLFEVSEQSESSVTLTIHETEETLACYPYKFRFSVRYELESFSLRTTFIVENLDDREMLFCVGGHPGINIPLFAGENFGDYTVIFEKEENISCPKVDLTQCLINPTEEEFHLTGNTIALRHNLFSTDALIFDEPKSESLAIVNREGHGVKVNFAEFPMIALWSSSDSGNFVALEPWQGCATLTTEGDIFAEKTHALRLNSCERKELGFVLEIM
ncbi:MAG: aldose 1-epimerase family protein [Clostridia bacterium]|nr:aldose 1-epimerase family protein [Clostridia bacterium]